MDSIHPAGRIPAVPFLALAVVSRSTDGGRSWTAAQVIMQQDEWGISPEYPTQTRDGSTPAGMPDVVSKSFPQQTAPLAVTGEEQEKQQQPGAAPPL